MTLTHTARRPRRPRSRRKPATAAQTGSAAGAPRITHHVVSHVVVHHAKAKKPARVKTRR